MIDKGSPSCFLHLTNYLCLHVIVFFQNKDTMALNAPQMGTLQVRWDPKNLEIKTKSVEKTLEPLVTQVKLSFRNI